MGCHSDTTTVDLCSESECVNSTITSKEGGRRTHLPSHGMFKFYRILFDRDMVLVGDGAEGALESAQDTLSELKEEGKPTPECVHCKVMLSLP